MVFKRRERLSWTQRVSQTVYPRTGWRRAVEYIGHRVKRLPDTPHKIALGFACGVFVSFSPLFGLHFFYAWICARIVRGNGIASLIGTFVGNPLTFPLIAASSFGLGRWITGMRGREHGESVMGAFSEAGAGLWQSFKSLFGFGEPALDRLGPFWSDVFFPYLIGGIFTGLITAAVFYFLTKPLVAAYQSRRRKRLLERAKQRSEQRDADQGDAQPPSPSGKGGSHAGRKPAAGQA